MCKLYLFLYRKVDIAEKYVIKILTYINTATDLSREKYSDTMFEMANLFYSNTQENAPESPEKRKIRYTKSLVFFSEVKKSMVKQKDKSNMYSLLINEYLPGFRGSIDCPVKLPSSDKMSENNNKVMKGYKVYI